jgi:hypothetical protein
MSPAIFDSRNASFSNLRMEGYHSLEDEAVQMIQGEKKESCSCDFNDAH